jgi:hypothetical protein
MAAAQPEVHVATKARVVARPMFAQRPHLATELLWPREAVVPEDSLVVPVEQPAVSLATREPAVKARVASQAPQHRVETADHQMAEAGEPVAALVLAEPAEPVQPLAVAVEAAVITAEAAEAQTSTAAVLMRVVAAEAHLGITLRSQVQSCTLPHIVRVQAWL